MQMQGIALVAATAVAAVSLATPVMAQNTVDAHVAAAKAAAGKEHTVLFDGLCKPASGPPQRAPGPRVVPERSAWHYEPVKVFDYGRFECDTGLAYRSAIARGRIRIVEDRAAKSRFFDALLAKYGTGTSGRPQGFYPRLDEVTVYAIAVERLTGKHCPLPPLSEQWPALDRTKSPNARP